MACLHVVGVGIICVCVCSTFGVMWLLYLWRVRECIWGVEFVGVVYAFICVRLSCLHAMCGV